MLLSRSPITLQVKKESTMKFQFKGRSLQLWDRSSKNKLVLSTNIPCSTIAHWAVAGCALTLQLTRPPAVEKSLMSRKKITSRTTWVVVVKDARDLQNNWVDKESASFACFYTSALEATCGLDLSWRRRFDEISEETATDVAGVWSPRTLNWAATSTDPEIVSCVLSRFFCSYERAQSHTLAVSDALGSSHHNSCISLSSGAWGIARKHVDLLLIVLSLRCAAIRSIQRQRTASSLPPNETTARETVILTFAVGDMVAITDLVSNADLNGRSGVVTGVLENGRHGVKLPGHQGQSERKLSVKPENLVRQPPPKRLETVCPTCLHVTVLGVDGCVYSLGNGKDPEQLHETCRGKADLTQRRRLDE